jgi:hypothetical protein
MFEILGFVVLLISAAILVLFGAVLFIEAIREKDLTGIAIGVFLVFSGFFFLSSFMSTKVKQSDYHQCVDECRQQCYLNIKE